MTTPWSHPDNGAFTEVSDLLGKERSRKFVPLRDLHESGATVTLRFEFDQQKSFELSSL